MHEAPHSYITPSGEINGWVNRLEQAQEALDVEEVTDERDTGWSNIRVRHSCTFVQRFFGSEILTGGAGELGEEVGQALNLQSAGLGLVDNALGELGDLLGTVALGDGAGEALEGGLKAGQLWEHAG